MDPAKVDVVLVRPSRAANVAAACRAMKNMGFRSLVLVGGVGGLERDEARALAYGAWDVLDSARRADTLADAVAPAALVAGTSGKPGAADWTPRRLAREAASLAGGGRLAVVFGPEASGLTNTELQLCRVRVHVPADPAHPSLNLAQAVLVLAYELRLAWLERAESDAGRGPAGEGRATVGELEEAIGDLREGLLGIGYLNPASPEAVLGELRSLLRRADPSRREVALLRGLARQVRWAGHRIARARSGNDNPASSTKGGL